MSKKPMIRDDNDDDDFQNPPKRKSDYLYYYFYDLNYNCRKIARRMSYI